MTPREIIRQTIRFENPERLAMCLREPYTNDMHYAGLVRSVDYRPRTSGKDEWGAVWENIGICNLGEVKDFPLKDWADFDKLTIPDPSEEWRWEGFEEKVAARGDKYLITMGISLYERMHFIRGLENTWMDIYDERENLEKLLDILKDISLYMIDRYGKYAVDGYMFTDDWGLQNSLMISPKHWREIWKPRYAELFQACHNNGIDTFMHSCGYIVDILDDLIEIGLDVIQMDQQENMGLDVLSERFKGRITFFNPVDIQQTMARGTTDQIKAYCHEMFKKLGGPEGGFIAKFYGDPKGSGHTEESLEAMFSEFESISKNYFK